MQEELIRRAKELLGDGTVVRVMGWRKGDMSFNPEPALFESEDSLSEFVYDGFCGANLSKYMIKLSKLEGKTLVFLKPCDTYSFNQLVKEHRADREKAYIIGVGCDGSLDVNAMKEKGAKGIQEIAEDGDTVKVSAIYGDKEFAREDVILDAAVPARAENIWCTMNWRPTRTRRSRREMAVSLWLRRLRRWIRKSVLRSGRTSCPAASAAMHAGMSVLPAAVSNVSLTMTGMIRPRKQLRHL